MIYTIDQLTSSTQVVKLDRMIPIFIGKTKVLVTETPVFINANHTLIQIDPEQNYIVDEDSIVPTIVYWKFLTSEITITNASATTTTVTLNYATTEKFNSNALFIVYDINTGILFSSTIESFIYSTSQLVSITLTDALSITGTLTCKLVIKSTDIIPFTYDRALRQIQLIFADRFEAVDLSFDLLGSTVTYDAIPNQCQLTIYQDITQPDIDRESNEYIAIGLEKSKSAIVVSIPNDSYINEALDKILSYRVGYYIVPIGLSNASINTIIQFCKVNRVDDFYCTIVSPSLITSSTIISDANFTVASTDSPDFYLLNPYNQDGFSVARTVDHMFYMTYPYDGVHKWNGANTIEWSYFDSDYSIRKLAQSDTYLYSIRIYQSSFNGLYKRSITSEPGSDWTTVLSHSDIITLLSTAPDSVVELRDIFVSANGTIYLLVQIYEETGQPYWLIYGQEGSYNTILLDTIPFVDDQIKLRWAGPKQTVLYWIEELWADTTRFYYWPTEEAAPVELTVPDDHTWSNESILHYVNGTWYFFGMEYGYYGLHVYTKTGSGDWVNKTSIFNDANISSIVASCALTNGKILILAAYNSPTEGWWFDGSTLEACLIDDSGLLYNSKPVIVLDESTFYQSLAIYQLCELSDLSIFCPCGIMPV